MNSKRFLIQLRYLGYRYHGVQKQPGLQSVQGRIEDVFKKSLKEAPFQTRFSSRTDALVSSLESYCLLMCEELFTAEAIQAALEKLPPDIEVISVKSVPDDFVLLKHSGEKEYHYYFCYNQKSFHPFAAAFMTHIREELDIELMKKGAQLFSGEHEFKNYVHKPRPGVDFRRRIVSSVLESNEGFHASFFPDSSFVFKVRGAGFMRGQVRAMMGALFRLGKGELSLEELKCSLEREDANFVKWLAPASGLILQSTEIK